MNQRFVVVAGTTATANIDGISAAGAAPDLMAHTPAADAEIVAFGRPVRAPTVPVSPTGCPTPSLVTRAALEAAGQQPTVIDAGLTEATAAPTIDAGVGPGSDLRSPVAVPAADTAFETGRSLGRAMPEAELVVGETIPGGTTTAMGVLAALGEPTAVSSSLVSNPLARKRSVVEEGLAASDVETGELAGRPTEAARLLGDPVLPTVAGLLAGAASAGKRVTLAGGSQMLAAAALARHAGVSKPLTVATTPFVLADDSADLATLASSVDVSLVATDPGFDAHDHVVFERYRAGEAKEGVGMGGALRLADRRGVPMADVRSLVIDRYERLVEDTDGP
ncbi:MAG: nicotinate-nucleotide--dimethylbenzimidazole phosphoribosyltransferase [Halanaeroarchaeum sp.]